MLGVKVVVTTITVSSARLCILSNYNRSSVRQGKNIDPTSRNKTKI